MEAHQPEEKAHGEGIDARASRKKWRGAEMVARAVRATRARETRACQRNHAGILLPSIFRSESGWPSVCK